MATNSAALAIVIKAQNDAEKALRQMGLSFDDIEKKAGRAQKSGGSFFSNLTAMAGGFVAANVLGRIAEGFGSIAGNMIDYNAKMETYTTTFAVFFQNSEKAAGNVIDFGKATEMAKTRMAELVKFAATTPFELPQVVQAGKVLQAFGIYSEENLTRFGNAASAAGISIDEMAQYMGRLKSGQFGETFQRLAELGIVTRQQLEMKGLTFDKGGAYTGSIEDATKAVNAIMDENYGGMMEKQSKTFAGMMSNVKDFMGQLIGKVGAPLFAKLGGMMAGALDWLGKPETVAMIDNIANVIGNVLGFALQKVADLFGFLWEVVKNVYGFLGGPLGVVIQAMIQNWGGIRDIVGGLVESFQAFLGVLGGDWSQLGDIKDIMSELFGPEVGGAAADILGSIATKFEDIKAVLPDVGAAASQAFDFITGKSQDLGLFEGVFNRVFGEGAGQKAADMLGIVKQAFDFLSPYVDKIKLGLQEFADKIGPYIGPALTNIGKLFAWIGEQIQKYLVPIFEAVLPHAIAIAKIAFDLFANIIGIAWDIISGFVTLVVQLISGDWAAAWQTAQDIVNNVKERILNILRDLWNIALQYLGALKDGALALFNALPEPVRTIFEGIRDTIVNAITFVQTSWDTIWGAIQVTAQTVWDAISGIIGPAIEGIKTNIETNINTAKAIWDLAINAMKLVIDTVFTPIATTIHDLLVGADGNGGILGTFTSAIGSEADGTGIVGVWSDAWNTIKDIIKLGGDIQTKISEGINSVKSDVLGFVTNSLTPLVDAVKILWDFLQKPWDWSVLDPGGWFGGGGGGGGGPADRIPQPGRVGTIVPGGLSSYPITTQLGEWSLGRYHSWGEDYDIPMGTPILAPGNVRITDYGWRGDWGNQISMLLSNGMNVVVSHLAGFTRATSSGSARTGEVLGYTDNTGYSTGPHLDIQTFFSGKPPVAPSSIPTLDSGAIVTRPTLALIGESGPEAVVPLKGRGFGSQINITINNPSIRDDSDITKLTDRILRELSWKSKLQGGLA